MNLARCALLSVVAALSLFKPVQVLAVQRDSTGQCPPGTSAPDSSSECLTQLEPVPVHGILLGGGGWNYSWPTIPIDLMPVLPTPTNSVSESEVSESETQKIQTSLCDENGGGQTAQTSASGAVATKRPVLIATGTKMLFEGDIAPIGDGIELGLARTYNANNTRIGAFGQTWSSSLDFSLVFEYQNVVCWAYLDRNEPCNPNGNPLLKIYAYNPSGYATQFSLVGGVWTSERGNTAQLIGGEWIVDYVDGSREVFGLNGQPKTIRNERGIGLTYNYNGSNQLTTITHTSGRSLSVTWSNGKIASATAPNGKVYSYTYTAPGFLASVTYPDGLGTRTYHHEDALGVSRVTGISVNGTRFSRYQFLSDGRAQWSGLEGGIERSSFGYFSDRTEVANALGQTTAYYVATVNGAKRVSRVVRPVTATCASGTVDMQYDVNGNVDYTVDALGVTTDYSYDADGRTTQKITGIGLNGETNQQQITQYVWDATRKDRLNQVKVFGTSTSQPLNTTTYSYYPDGDARAKLLQSVAVTNQGGGTVGTLTTSYDYTLHSNGLIATLTVDGPLSGSGDAATSTFDSAGNLLTITNSLGHTISYSSYNTLGQPGTVTSPNGAVTQYTYNARGQVLSEARTVNGVAQTTTVTYDNRGRPVGVVTADGYGLNTSYDAYDRITSIYRVDPLEDMNDPSDPDYQYNRSETRKQEFVYNLLSQPLTVTTSYTLASWQWDQIKNKAINVGYTNTQNKTTYEYDAGGFLSKQKGEHGQSLTYTYNGNGDLVSAKDALNNTTSYTYDRNRRPSSITDPAAGVTMMEYNALGLLTLARDARNNSTSYGYDGFGNLLSQISPDTGTTTFQFNTQGQRTQEQRADLSTLNFTYDGLGRLASLTGGGQTRALTYDSCANGKGMLCTAAKTGGAPTTASFTYTPWGQVATRQDSLNGVTDAAGYSYDGMGRLSGISYPSGISVGYLYSQGNLSNITATVNGVTTTVETIDGYQFLGPPTYRLYGNYLWGQTNYDTDRRLTGISTNNGGAPIQSLTYGFNAANQVTAITNGVDTGLTQTYGYDNLSRLTSANLAGGNAASFGYDAVGNRTTAGNTSPTNSTSYTVAGTSNRMTQSVTGGLTRTFTHNDNGDITAFTNSAGVANTLAYDPFGRLASHTKSGVTTTYTVNALDQRIAKSNASSTSRYVYAGFNQLLAETTNGAWSSYIWNGSEPVAMVRNNQIYYLHNDHLGRPQMATNSSKVVVWKASNLSFDRTVTQDSIGGINLAFPGQYLDIESGILHNGFREFLPDSGRYLQSDPIGLSGGINTFAYVESDPVDAVDPFGLDTLVIVGGPSDGNPFGHIAIAFTGRGVYTYGTKEGLASSVTTYLKNQAAYRSSVVYRISTTPAQEAKMLARILSYDGKKLPDPRKDLLAAMNDTCATRTADALEAGGISSPFSGPNFLPGAVAGTAAWNSSSFNIIPQGGTVPSSLGSFNP